MGVGLRTKSMQTEGDEAKRERERDACNVFTLGISVNGNSSSCKEKEQSRGHDSTWREWHPPP